MRILQSVCTNWCVKRISWDELCNPHQNVGPYDRFVSETNIIGFNRIVQWE